jgi:hypothetical protein
MSRVIQVLYLELWLHKVPNGLIHWRYFGFRLTPLAKQHRQFWWANKRGIPRLIWLIIELWRWLRWVFYYAWVFSWKATRSWGAEVYALEGLSINQQFWRVLKLAITWCIPPSASYQFRLYQSSASPLSFIFNHESPGYHAIQNKPYLKHQESLELIQDKLTLANKLKSLGVRMVDTLHHQTRGSNVKLRQLINAAHPVFCKSRFGNQGIGAFSAWQTTKELRGFTFQGTLLANEIEVESAWANLLSLDDALIQPKLITHAALIKMGNNQDVITVRYITKQHKGTILCLASFLEIPVGQSKTGQNAYTFLPIDPQNGEIRKIPNHVLLNTEAKTDAAHIWKRSPKNKLMPFWAELCHASLLAHQHCSEIHAIAWDWVITDDGPVMLEGNTGWGVLMPQILKGKGLLLDDD